MQVSAETMRILLEMEAPAEQKAALLKAMEADWLAFSPPSQLSGTTEERERVRNGDTKAERKRAADRERMAAKREAERVARLSREQNATVLSESRDSRATVAGDTRDGVGDSRADEATPRARVRDISPKLVITGSAVAAVERATGDDWPEGSAQDHAKLLVAEAASPWLNPNKSPDLITTASLLAAWRRDGASWEHDVKPVVIGLVAKRRGKINSWKFFRDAVAQQIADNRQALSIPEARVVPLRPGGVKTREEQNRESWDYAIARLAEDER